jgi:RHS repeat-associated protein
LAAEKTGVGDQVLALPKGGGDVRGLGERFQADPQTGTGSFAVPIELPGGRAGTQPGLQLTYATGAPNGPFGLGWDLPVPSISRKLARGVPSYSDDDVFILGRTEELMPVGGGEYRVRTEGLFSEFRHVRDAAGADYWEATTKAGVRQTFGRDPESQVYADGPAGRRIVTWRLSETLDPAGNHVVYEYKPDRAAIVDLIAPHGVNQTYLAAVYYVDYADDPTGAWPGGRRWLYRVVLDYGAVDGPGWALRPDLVDATLPAAIRQIEQAAAPQSTVRPDPFSTHRPGFELRTQRRCWRLRVETLLSGATAYQALDAYYLRYEQAPYSGISLLQSIQRVGMRPGRPPIALPAIRMAYSGFAPESRRLEPFSAACGWMPERSLSDPDSALIDLHGSGLPDVLHAARDGHRVWRNLGRLRFRSPPHAMERFPAGLALGDDGVQLADMEGNGSVDVLVTSPDANVGYYRNSFKGEWGEFRPYQEAPSFDLEDPDVALVDLDGDGVIDVLATLPESFLFFRNRGPDGWASPEVVPRRHDSALFPDVTLGAPDGRIRLADVSGDGLVDLVAIYDGRVDYWPSLGCGRFGSRVTMASSPRLPPDVDPGRLFLTDVNGDGLADLVYVEADRVRVWLNRSGNAWSDEVTISGTPLPESGGVRVSDMRGSGTAGVLWTYAWSAARPRNYIYLDFTAEVKPHLLERIDNGIGGTTTISYRPSTEYMVDDADAGRPWRTHLPFPVQVVAEVHVHDAATGHHGSTCYAYHHGRYDGEEQLFVGFGGVDIYDSAGGPGRAPVSLTRQWHHLGDATNLSDEYAPVAAAPGWRPPPNLLAGAQRALRGSILRAELYGLDASPAALEPYRVHDVFYDAVPLPGGAWFPKRVKTQTTTLERGIEPRTELRRYRYDDELGGPAYGNVVLEERVGIGRTGINAADPGEPIHRRLQATPLSVVIVTYFAPPSPGVRIRDRPSQVLQISGPLTAAQETALLTWAGGPLADTAAPPIPAGRVLARELVFYDGEDFYGLGHPERALPASRLTHGLLTARLRLAATDPLITAAYGAQAAAARNRWRSAEAAYRFGPAYGNGLYWQAGEQRAFVRRADGTPRYGLVRAERDARGGERTWTYDSYLVFPTRVTDAGGYPTAATYDYLVPGIRERTDANMNATWVACDGLGRVERVAQMGKVLARDAAGVPTSVDGDAPAYPSLKYEHHLDEQPAREVAYERVVRATAGPDREDDYLVAHSFLNGRGRVLQARTRVAPGPLDPSNPASPTVDPRWAVSGWEELNEKGQIARRYRPVFAASAGFGVGAAQAATPYTDFAYDPPGRIVESTFADGTRSRVTYGAWEVVTADANDLGGAIAASDPRYGDLLPLLSTHLDTPSTEHVDAWGRVVAQTGHAGRDATGQATLLTTTYERDGLDRIVRVHDARGIVAHEERFDLLGRPMVRNYWAGGSLRQLVHDAAGQLIWRRDGRGVAVRLAYDVIGREESVSEETPGGLALREHRTYRPYSAVDAAARAANLFGRVEVIRTGTVRVAYTYDYRGLPRSKTLAIWADVWNDWTSGVADLWQPGQPGFEPPARPDDIRGLAALPGFPGGIVQRFAYDALGRLRIVTHPDGREVRLEHTAGNQVARVTVAAGAVTTTIVDEAEYGADDQLRHVRYGNGVTTQYSFDDANLALLSLTSRQAGGRTIQSLDYRQDPVGNLWRVTDNLADTIINGQQVISNTRRFEYDPLYRLIRAQGRVHRNASASNWTFAAPNSSPSVYSAYNHRYAYDETGNFTRNDDYGLAGISYDPTRPDRFMGGGAEFGNFTYDGDGNLTHSPRHQALRWDHAGQLEYADLGGGGRVRCFYLPDGQRVLKLVRRNGRYTATLYLGDEFELRFRRVSSGITRRATVMVRAGTALVAVLATGDLAANEPPTLFVHSDEGGNASVLTLSSGALFSQESYFPFGGTSDRRYARSRYRFAAKERDEETGLCYFGARYYDPAIGRWISADPIGGQAGVNLYVFVRNNPARYRDPVGLFEWGEFFKAAAVGILVGIVVGVAAIALAVAFPVVAPFLIAAGIVGALVTAAVVVQAARGRDLFGNPIDEKEQARRIGGAVGGIIGGAAAGPIAAAAGIGGGAAGGGLIPIAAGAGGGRLGSLASSAGSAAFPEAVGGIVPGATGVLGISTVYTPAQDAVQPTVVQMGAGPGFATRPGTAGTNEVRTTSSGGRNYQVNSGHGYRVHGDPPNPLTDPSRAGPRDDVELAIIRAIDSWLSGGNTAPALAGRGSVPQTLTVEIAGVKIQCTFGGKPDGTIVVSDYWAL